MTKFGETQSIGKPSPVRYYVDVKSNKDLKITEFKCYDRETEQKIDFAPEEFVLLLVTNGVSGWDDATNTAVFSNEVINTKKESLKVCAEGGKKIVYEGFYDKNTINGLGYKFTKYIYVLEGGAIYKYTIKGDNIHVWNDDTQGIDFNQFKIAFDKVEERKNKAVVYYVPRWKQGKKLTPKDIEEATAMVELLDAHRTE